MSIILKSRNPELVEWMDCPDCDRQLLFNTYRQFSKINQLLSGWDSIYRNRIRPLLLKSDGRANLLDIGCGGGDILRKLGQWCERDGFNISFTGIDPDVRSFEYLNSLEWPENFTFKQVESSKLVDENLSFDIVISNHLMHHLKSPELQAVCRDAVKLSSRLVIFSDIERSDIGYALFSAIAPLLFRNSYIVKDGLISIQRSFQKDELSEAVPGNWMVERQFPFRLLAIHQKGDEHEA
jgi:2-polyprenyl-3-methyl-5-hydroxy-6-metoxy-1,4-benzoquinol methylase